MAVFATDSTRFSGVVKFELHPELSLCRDSIVINDTAATLKVGAVLGKVTANGKYKLATAAANDGSQNPCAVLIVDGLGLSRDIVLAGNTDTKAIALTRGPVIVSDAYLQLGAGITAAAAKAALQAVGILVETGV